MDNIISLIGPDGEARFEFLDLIAFRGNEYVVVVPLDDPDSQDQLMILRMEPEDPEMEGQSFCGIADEAELFAVYEIFKDKFRSEFSFSDEEAM